MKVFYHKDQMKYNPKNEFCRNNVVRPYAENKDRINLIVNELKKLDLDIDIKEPNKCSIEDLSKTHSTDYIDFLQNVPQKLTEDAPTSFSFPNGTLKKNSSYHAKLGYYLFDPSTPITKDTWISAKSSADAALSTINALEKDNLAISLNRPPGHHASRSVGGGYCFLNNIAIAAQNLVDMGKSVSILDVDYHHGNGTQAIFYDTEKVQYVSIHADPVTDYPYYWGYREETGDGMGAGFNVNYPLDPTITGDDKYDETLEMAIKDIKNYNPDYLLLSLGLDCYVLDPVGGMQLSLEYYERIGKKLLDFEKLGIFLEGGYSKDIGKCFANVVKGVL